MARRLRPLKIECLLTVETKALAFAYETARCLGHGCIAVAGKTVRRCSGPVLRTTVHSITSGQAQRLYLGADAAAIISSKRIALFDDCISTGSTMQGLMRLAGKAGAEIGAVAAVWLEGPGPFEKFGEWYGAGRLVWLDTFPLFARGAAYRALCARAKAVLDRMGRPGES
jgi:adenine phosphoribosyltransferase